MFKKVEKEITVDELKKVNKKHTLIIDVRNKDEFDSVHIPNAINVPRKDLIKEPQLYINDTAYIICDSGSRSRKAVKKLQKDYDVVNVKGGTNAYGKNYGLIRTKKITVEKTK